ncbi:MAG: hypothetical protein ABJA98_16590 [Acidobacteriota bacterium]
MVACRFVMTVAALVCAALAIWASGGSLTLLPLQSGAPRAGLLPSILWLAIAVAAALILAWRLSPAVAKRAPVWLLSALVLLPWLPIRVPYAFLIWAGPLRFWVLAMLAVAVTSSALAQRAPPLLRALVMDPRRAPWLAGTIAACLYIAGAWAVSPHLPAGDEPHYLVITQSLLRDGDLKVENNYLRREYREFYAGDLQPHYLRRGQNQEIYSVHAPGLPAVVAPVFALFGYPGVIVFLSLVSAAATALTWTAVWRITRDAAASWFGWSAVALSAPFFFQAFTMYPDAPGGALLMVAVLALTADEEPSTAQLLACGAALALMPWLHTRFAILASMAGAALAFRLITAERALHRMSLLLAIPVVSALAWFAFFYLVYGTVDPAAPYNGYTQTSVTNLGRGVPGLLIDQQFGLLPNAPVYFCAALGLLPLVRRSRRLAAELIAIAAPYALAVAAYQMWWAGYSSPARFLTPILLPLGIPLGVWFASTRSSVARILGVAAVAVSLLITVTVASVERGALLFNSRDGASRLLLWLSPLVDLTRGMPSLFQNPPATAIAHAVVWLLAFAVAAIATLIVGRRNVRPVTTVLIAGATGAASVMLALSLVWRSNGVTPTTAANASAALRRSFAADAGQLGVRYSPFRVLAASDVVLAATREEWPGTMRPLSGPLVSLQYPLAATYELVATVARPGAGRLSVVLDREFGAAWSWVVPDQPGEWRQTFTLPTPATGMLVDADAATRRTLNRLVLRPVQLLDHGGLANIRPLHAVRYGPAVVMLLGGHVYVEPGGAWIAGGSEADLAIAPDPGNGIRLFLRNSPVDNRVTLTSGAWRQELTLTPREERLLDVPVDKGTGGARVRVSCASGARPSDVEHSDDTRLLGCWIETR